MKYAKLIIVLAVLGCGVWYASRLVHSQDKRNHYHCRDFDTQRQAQQVFMSNTKAFAYLDRNHDLIACNKLKK